MLTTMHETRNIQIKLGYPICDQTGISFLGSHIRVKSHKNLSSCFCKHESSIIMRLRDHCVEFSPHQKI